MKQFDFLVLGSGLAGLSFALKVAPHGRVAIVTKKDRAESNTNYAQGGIASVTSKEDSFELHVRDTLQAGAGLCKEAAVRTHRRGWPGAHCGVDRAGHALYGTRDSPFARRTGARPRPGGRPLEAPHPAREGHHRPRDRACFAGGGGRAAEHHDLREPPRHQSDHEPEARAQPATTSAWGSMCSTSSPGRSRPSPRRSRCSPPAAAGRCISTPPTRTSRRATGWPWPGVPERRWPTWSSSSSIPPACTIPRRSRS